MVKNSWFEKKHEVVLCLQMGFDAVFFARLDYQDYAARKQAKKLELVWRGSQSLGICQLLCEVFDGKNYN